MWGILSMSVISVVTVIIFLIHLSVDIILNKLVTASFLFSNSKHN